MESTPEEVLTLFERNVSELESLMQAIRLEAKSLVANHRRTDQDVYAIRESMHGVNKKYGEAFGDLTKLVVMIHRDTPSQR